jgi:predicted porin
MKLRAKAAFFTSMGLACALGARTANAQSSVDMTGLLSAGVSYTNNLAGQSSVYSNSGVLRPNSLAFRGQEDLGGGMKAIFYLGTLFSMTNGSVLGAPGSLFSRESFVGVDTGRGILTAGQHRDFMFDILTISQYSGAFYSGLYGAHQGPFPSFGVPYNIRGSYDFDRLNGETLNNTVRYKLVTESGLTVGAMYGFGGVPGNFGNSSSQSFGVNYEFAHGGVGAAYTMEKPTSIENGEAGIRNIGVGGRYKVGKLQLAVLGTVSRNTSSGAQIDALDLTGSYDISPFWNFATTYTYMDGNAPLHNDHANQVASTLTYRLSKRTSIYAVAAWQRASGAGALARINSMTSPSSTNTQVTAALNLQHLF